MDMDIRTYLSAHMRHILLEFLPSPDIKLVSRQLLIANHLDMIRDSMWAIHAVILVANLRALKQPKLKKWLQDVNAVIVGVHNILEVIQDFYQQPKEQKQEVTTSPNLLPHPASISASTFFKKSSRHRAILVDLKKISQSLNFLLSRMIAFGLQIDMTESMDPNQVEYYSILRQEVVERDDDVNKILQLMFQLQEGQSARDISDDVPFVIAITGEPRMGKSTLARMVYHHPLVCEVFKHRIWVDVSHDSYSFVDYRQITRECARHLTGTISSNVDNWSLIRQSLAQTRFLLVIDGFTLFRDEDKYKLEELMNNLLCLGAPGSRLIITCRDYSITENNPMVYSEGKYRLREISQDVCTKIFLRYAIPTTLHDQGKQNSSSIGMTDMLNLANKIYGHEIDYHNPHDAKLLGLILRNVKLNYSKFHLDIFEYVDVMSMHYASYQSTQLNLYNILAAQLPLSIAEGYFDMLVTEGSFKYSRKAQQENQNMKYGLFHNIPYELFQNTKVIYHFRKMDVQEFRIPQQCRYLCILVDSDTSTLLTKLPARIANNLRMLLLYKVKEETHLQLQKYQEASSIEIPKSLVKNLIILSIIDTGIQQLPNRISMLLRLRYLNISEMEMEELPESIYDLYNLHVLSLSHCKKLLKLPEQIYNLAKLQILRLSYCTRLQKLPKSISRLVNLQVLDIEACHWLKELPKDLRYLEGLIVLNMIGCASLTQIPLGISELTNLEALSGYMVDDYDHKSLALKELQSLTNIEQLHVRHLERVLNLNDIEMVNLKEKKYLENLVLHWEWWNMDVRVDDQRQSLEVLDSFQPIVSHLQSLEIISYFGMQLPSWIMIDEQPFFFEFLVEMKLVNLKRCENLPSLGILPSLRILEMSGLDSLTYVGNTISNDKAIFPSLQELTLSEMPNLVEWNARCSFHAQLITLIHCPKLIRLSGFQYVDELSIWLQSEMLGQYFTCFQSKDITKLKIVGCQELRWLPKDIINCTRLYELSIIRCNKILSMPDWLHEMPRLYKILISGCTTMQYIPEELKQKLEDRIIIQGCPKLQAQTG